MSLKWTPREWAKEIENLGSGELKVDRLPHTLVYTGGRPMVCKQCRTRIDTGVLVGDGNYCVSCSGFPPGCFVLDWRDAVKRDWLKPQKKKRWWHRKKKAA